jgi:hypothetical protein
VTHLVSQITWIKKIECSEVTEKLTFSVSKINNSKKSGFSVEVFTENPDFQLI